MRKSVLITGVTRGIGRAIAEKFLREGYVVHGTFFSSHKKADEMKKQFGEENLKLYGPYDFTNLEDTDKLINELAKEKFDTVVCNAGMFSENDDFKNFDILDFNSVMNCNFYTPMMLSIKLKDNINSNGSIVIMSSNDAYNGAFTSISYSTSKAALLSVTKSLSVNFGYKKVRVNSVAPGAINTDMNTPEQEFEAPQYTPLERIGQPDEVAEVVYFLASPSSSFINGENITIDGGYSVVSILLKNEAQRIRTEESYIKSYGDYEYVYELYKNIKEGNELLHISPCLNYTWIDNKKEKEFLKQNLEAEERGANITRILVVPKEREDELTRSKIIEEYLKQSQPQTRTYLIKEKDLKEILTNKQYENIKDGYGVFDDDRIFIDEYNSDKSIGYMIRSKELAKKYIDLFNSILAYIENGRLKTLTHEYCKNNKL